MLMFMLLHIGKSFTKEKLQQNKFLSFSFLFCFVDSLIYQNFPPVKFVFRFFTFSIQKYILEFLWLVTVGVLKINRFRI